MAAQRLNGVAEPASTEAQVQADAKRYTELEQRRHRRVSVTVPAIGSTR